jgi:hypothetical protein
MSGNNFEKQVQKKMEELQFVPSQQVWQNVEKELRKEKKSRRWLILPVLLLGMLAGVYFVFNQKDTAGLSNAENTPLDASENNIASEPSVTNQPAAPALAQQQMAANESGNKTNSATVTQLNNDDPLAGRGVVKELLPDTSSADINNIGTKEKNKKQTGFPGREEKFLYVGKSKNKMPATTESSDTEVKNSDGKEQIGSFQSLTRKSDADKKDNDRTVAVISAEDKPAEIASAATKQPESQAAKEVVPEKDSIEKARALTQTMDSITKKATVVKSVEKKNKWKWLGSIETGFSNLNNGFAPLGALGISGVSEAAKSATTSSPVSLQTNASPFQLSSPPPANPRPGFSFKLGVAAERAISKRSKFAIGIGYAFLSTRGSSGQVAGGNSGGANFGGVQTDLLNSRQYYLNTSNKEFGNEYHFLQIPVSFSTLLGRGKRLPFYWNTGVNVNYLLTSNALVYDNISRAYYKDKGIFRPLQLGWHTGIDAEIFSRKSHPLRLGPQFSFNFSQLLKTPSGDKQRFAYAGIRAGIQLNKK